MAPPSVPSSPNPRLIRPTQPRGRWIHGLLSAGHAFPLLSRGGENHRLCFLRARKNRAGVPTYCHDTSRFSDLLLCPPPRRAIPCWSRTDLTAEGSRCRFDAHKRPRPRRATRASTQGRSHEVPSARERANCLSGAAAAKARFILLWMVSQVYYLRVRYRTGPEGGRGGAPKPPGRAWGPIWGRGNGSRLRGLPGTPIPERTRRQATFFF